MFLSRTVMFGAALLLAGLPAEAADTAPGAVELTGGNSVPQNPTLPRLNLTEAQRRQVREVLAAEPTEIEFRLKSTKSAKSFDPRVGAKLPRGVKPDGLPSALTQTIPQLADYGYAKMKNEILLVDAMTGTIAAIVPEGQAKTAGQN